MSIILKTFHSPQNHHPDKDELSSNEMRPRVQTAPGAHNARENSREPNPEDQQKIIRFEQEIGNIQDFGFEAFYSGTGGYVGIFLGYSLLQLPDLIDVNWKEYWKNLKLICSLTDFIAFIVSFMTKNCQWKILPKLM